VSVPSVAVQRAPDGWTHIGGPGMHLLISLEEDDERTLLASDHADGGDLDDVIDYVTTRCGRRRPECGPTSSSTSRSRRPATS
jgi:hypothetical protein